ncbi:TPA: hypothetical protein ACSE73_000318 [Acinetobacter baumannii]
MTVNPDEMGGYVTFSTAPAAGIYFYVAGATPLDQLLDITNYDNFYPEAIERALDKLTALLQEWGTQLDQEKQARILADIHYDSLAMEREENLENRLISYINAVVGITNPAIFDGISDRMIITEDGRTQRDFNKSLPFWTDDYVKFKQETYLREEQILDHVQEQDQVLQIAIDTEKQRALDAEGLLDGKINAIGVGNKAYLTYAEMDADKANIPINSKVTVTSDPDTSKRGDWQWNGTVFTKSSYDPLQQMKDWANGFATFKVHVIAPSEFSSIDQILVPGQYICNSDSIAATIAGIPVNKSFHLEVSAKGNAVSQEFKPFFTTDIYVRTSNASLVFPAFQKTASTSEVAASINNAMSTISYKVSKNMFNSATVVNNSRLSATGAIANVTNAKRSAHIPVGAGRKYTISWSNSATVAPTIAFFANTTDLQGVGYASLGLVPPVTITVPANVEYMIINTKHESSVELTNLQIELGEEATEYSPYAETGTVIKDGALLPPVLKDYEKLFESVNLFNESTVIPNYFLSSVNGALSPSTGWTISGFIPVVAGRQYTLSGQRSRQGISFFPTNEITTNPAISYINDSSMPITVTAPAGANYAVIALESASLKGWSNIQFEEGPVDTQYIPYGKTLTLVDSEYLTTDIATVRNKFSLIDGVGYIQNYISDFKAKLNVRVYNPLSSLVSSAFNFVSDDVNAQNVRLCDDDAAPVRMMGATIGANHGYAKAVLTANGHGKTSSDIGSVWSDGSKQWVIIEIISVNSLAVTCRTENLSFSGTLPTLTHVSGANNTSNIVPTAVVNNQWRPMLKNHLVKHIVDGELIAETTGDWPYKSSVAILESYDLMEKNAIVEWVIANNGAYTVPYNAESALNVSMNYTFDTEGGCVIPSNFFTYKSIQAQDLMFTQAARLKLGVDGQIKYYVPRSVAFTQGSQPFDFSIPTVVDSLSITDRIDFDVAKTESGAVLPDRLIMLNDTIGFAVGYLPILDAAPEVRNARTSKGIQISTSEAKVYPYLVDGLTTLNAGNHYSCVAYRKYFKRKANRTCDYVVRSKYGDFLFLDWHTMNQIDVIELASDLAGREVEIIEQTANVQLLSSVATSRIAVKIGAGSSARLILKFS